MEENQNVNANSPKKKMGKAKKIIIAIIAVLVVAISVVAVLGFTGKLDFNFSKKSKADAGIGKVGEVFSQTATDLETEYNEAGLNVKLTDFEEVEMNLDMSVDINEFEVDGMDSEEEEIMDAVIELVNNIDLNANVKASNEKGGLKLGATINEEPVSVEVAFDGEKVGLRSEELNEKWLTLELQEILDEYADEFELDEETMAELEELMASFEELITDLVLTNEEVEHFKSTYSNMLTDYILSLDIKSEKDKIKVGKKEKNCTKTTITLDEDDIKDLLITYVEKAKDDEEGQKIVKEKITVILDFIIENEELFETDSYYYDDYYYDYYDDYSYTYEEPSIVEEAEELKETIDEAFNSETFDTLIEAIEEIELEGLEITIESYASVTDVYATNITFELDEESVTLEMVFDGDTTNAVMSMDMYGQSMEVVEFILKNEKNHKALEIKIAEDAVENGAPEMSAMVDMAISENKLDTSFELDLGEEGNMKISQEMNVKTNTESEYSVNTKTNIKFDIPDAMKCDMTLNVDSSIKTSGVDFTSIDECIDLTDAIIEGNPDKETEEELYQYILDAVPGVVNVLESVKGFEIVELVDGTESIDEVMEMLEDLTMEDLKGTIEPTIEVPLY